MRSTQTVGETLAEMAENRHCDLTPDCLITVEVCGFGQFGRENQSHTGQRLSSTEQNQNGPTPRANAMPSLTKNALELR